MKPALTLTALCVAFVLPSFPVAAQEHVDVPLPPYDPPPAASHHRETQSDQSLRAPRPSNSPPPKASRQPHSESNRHIAKKPGQNHHYHQKRKHHRRHKSFRWPWEHRK
jgi:hypothetical protein